MEQNFSSYRKQGLPWLHYTCLHPVLDVLRSICHSSQSQYKICIALLTVPVLDSGNEQNKMTQNIIKIRDAMTTYWPAPYRLIQKTYFAVLLKLFLRLWLLSENSYLLEGLQSADKTKTCTKKQSYKMHPLIHRKRKPLSCLFTFGDKNKNSSLPIV